MRLARPHTIHGMQEYFLPYFASKGYDAYAVSLRAHGESDFVEGETGSFDDHLDDLASIIESLPRPPVVVAHSLGGILLQRWAPATAQDAHQMLGSVL